MRRLFSVQNVLSATAGLACSSFMLSLGEGLPHTPENGAIVSFGMLSGGMLGFMAMKALTDMPAAMSAPLKFTPNEDLLEIKKIMNSQTKINEKYSGSLYSNVV